MPWMDWFAHKHPFLVHLPLAVALLLPLALLASLRPGRGIRPWWLVCRYLFAWGWFFMVPVALSGLMLARRMNLLAWDQFLAGKGSPEMLILRQHQLLAGGTFLLGILVLYLLVRRRQDHQSLGPLAFLGGLLFCGGLLVTAHHGTRLSRPVQQVVVEKAVAAPVAVSAPRVVRDPLRPGPVLDYLALEPIQPEPVKTTFHGLRWIRTYVTPASAEAYRKGEPLPTGTLVVMASWEDRWGRPGFDSGPFYALEVKADGRNELTCYWAKVPEAKRAEMGGAERIYWKGNDSNLEACMACHAQGVSPLKDRSKVFPFRKPKPETGTVPGQKP